MKKGLKISAILMLVTAICSCNMDLYTGTGVLPEYEESPITMGSAFNPETAPDFVVATDNAFSDHIRISWRGVPGAKSYQVERRAEGAEDWTVLKDTAYNTLYYTDRMNPAAENSIVPGVRYEYRVQARSSEGVVGAYSDITVGRMLAAPDRVEASKGDSKVPGIEISWNRLPGVSNYRIYMKLDNYTSFVEVGLVTSTSSDDDCRFIFPITESENAKLAGRELIFAVKAIAPNSAETSAMSISRVGYSYVKGAPAPVHNLKVDKGINTDFSKGITISWDDLGEEFDYVIYRSAPGKEEAKIYKVFPNQKIDRQGGKVTFVDTDQNAFDTSVGYTYSVIATTLLGGVEMRGPAVMDTGFFISPPEELRFERVIMDSELGYGFELSFEKPFGFDSLGDLSEWHFNIYGWNGSRITEKAYSEGFTNFNTRVALMDSIREASVLTDIVTVPADGADSEGRSRVRVYFGENRCDAFAVTLSNADGSMETYPGKDSFYWNGAELRETKASRNVFFEGMPANANGVYPVKVSFTYEDYGLDFINGLKLYVEGQDEPYTEILLDSDGKTRYLMDTSAHRKAGQFYTYTIEASDVFGHSSKTRVTGGYGAITPQEYLVFFCSTAFKPWEVGNYLAPEEFTKWKNTNLGRKIQAGYAADLNTQMASLGSAVEYDHVRGGSVNYDASMEGIGGQIYFVYKQFGETDFMYSTGAYEMHVDSSGTGSTSSSTGGIKVEGLYPGHIGWGGLKVTGKRFSGNYKVKVDYANSSAEEDVKATI